MSTGHYETHPDMGVLGGDATTLQKARVIGEVINANGILAIKNQERIDSLEARIVKLEESMRDIARALGADTN